MWIVGRADYSDPRFYVEVRWHYGFLSRLLARHLNWNLRVKIDFKGHNRPCADCYAGIERDLIDLLGPDAEFTPPYSKDTDAFDERDRLIELDVVDHEHRSPLLGDDFEEITDILSHRLTCCKAGTHYNLDLVS